MGRNHLFHGSGLFYQELTEPAKKICPLSRVDYCETWFGVRKLSLINISWEVRHIWAKKKAGKSLRSLLSADIFYPEDEAKLRGFILLLFLDGWLAKVKGRKIQPSKK